jgi:hypothetical protein
MPLESLRPTGRDTNTPVQDVTQPPVGDVDLLAFRNSRSEISGFPYRSLELNNRMHLWNASITVTTFEEQRQGEGDESPCVIPQVAKKHVVWSQSMPNSRCENQILRLVQRYRVCRLTPAT